ncbi:hypothetical protein K2173_027817 [Erythroxylum novogranatense]|uniref:TFIIS N-terminal domain-containing protein n=1 Tax=Erythroxylum novogranatense TaxID=1862640 RepID=A0AAV8U2N4_9ROSI|nr:hypothetical protein K2173_027817 [Erythroxylum novogranatense]
MTLEDFFTLNEMKDGLTSPSRVQELVAVMQKEKDCIVKNIGDTTRQWAAVASTIAATENKECLDLFIQLDGLCFFGTWLKDAQNFANDTSDGFVEESISALLRALEKLHIDKERSISSGIFITVNNLLDHKSSRVQDRARALFNSWKGGRVSYSMSNDGLGAAEFHTSDNNEKSKTESAVAIPPSKGSDDEENNTTEPGRVESLQSRSSSSLRVENVEDVQVQPPVNNHLSPMILDPKNEEGRSPNNTSIISFSVQESPVKEKPALNSSGLTSSAEVSSFTVPNGQIDEEESDSSKKPGVFQDPIASTAVKTEAGAPPGSDASSAQEQTDSVFQSNTDDIGAANQFNDQVLKSTANNSNCSTETVADFSEKDSRSDQSDDGSSHASQTEDIVRADDVGEHSYGDDVMVDTSDLSKLTIDIQSSNPVDRTKPDIELEYGIVDALEVARQVAQEVEREVVDYKEPSCSSSSGKIMNIPGSPDSVSGNEELPSAVAPDDMSARNHTPAEHTEEECQLGYPDNQVAGTENGSQELGSLTELTQEQEVHCEKGPCNFDLNQEVHSDDVEHSMNPILTPVSVVSASRPMAVSGSPAAPLEFGGTLGWKGSAATSAFRPASPRKISDGDKTVETDVSNNSSKQRHFCLGIDLNVAEDGDEKLVDVTSERQISVSSGINSGESSLELGPTRSERPNLDLNRISDDGDAPPANLRMEGRVYFPLSSYRSPSPASSSSTMQPSVRNFDLNDRPFFSNDFSDQGLYHGKSPQNVSAYKGNRPSNNVVSIFGTRLEVGSRVEARRKDLSPQIISFPNCRYPDTVVDSNVARMGGPLGMVPLMSFSHSPVLGYSGLPSAPTMSISGPMCGPGSSIPYMVDSRGAPVMPQLMGSASIVPPYAQPPFVMSMSDAPLGPSIAGSSRSNFDLNSGFGVDGGSTGSLRQFFMPSQGRSFNASSQLSSSSGVGEKRKEPDTGWEPFSLQHKHPQAPWR